MIEQVGALPYRVTSVGAAPSILLVTSRQTGRWVVPKGNLMLGKAPHEAAAIEAEEEAGVRGRISPLPIGRFDYIKILPDGSSIPAEVMLFLLAVEEEMASWKEEKQRRRQWFTAVEAAVLVEEVGLSELIHQFGEGRGPRLAN
ncbi:MAG: NUDIX hydrolase [Sphingomicrobium sp.]